MRYTVVLVLNDPCYQRPPVFGQNEFPLSTWIERPPALPDQRPTFCGKRLNFDLCKPQGDFYQNQMVSSLGPREGFYQK